MFKKSKSDSKSYGIIGLGRFGSALAVELAKSGAEPLVIDGNEEKVREMREYTENAFVVNSFDKKTLSETGIQNCDVVVVCIGEKMDTSILTTLNVVSLGVRRSYQRPRAPSRARYSRSSAQKSSTPRGIWQSDSPTNWKLPICWTLFS